MARAKKLKCSARYGSFGFGGLSPIKQCTKPATVRETHTVDDFVSSVPEFSRKGGTYVNLFCDRHRTTVTSTTSKSLTIETI